MLCKVRGNGVAEAAFRYEYGIHGLQGLYGPHNKYKTSPDLDLEHNYGHQSTVEYDIHYFHRKALGIPVISITKLCLLYKN